MTSKDAKNARKGIAAVLPSTMRVYESAGLVAIDRESIALLSREYSNVGGRWWTKAPTAIPKEYESALALLFAFNATSFYYWSSSKWRRRFGAKWYDGSWAMYMALNRALSRYSPKLVVRAMADLTLEQYKEWIGGKGDLRDTRRRWRILRGLGQKVVDASNGFHGIIEAARWDAAALVDLLWKDYGFNDFEVYHNQEVWFLKRAQLLTADISGLTQLKLGRTLLGVERLTGSADYKIPQYLRHRGVLVYRDGLASAIDRMKRIPQGSDEEIEIRAATIVAIDLLRERVACDDEMVLASDLSDWLWLEAQNCKGMKPYHRTATSRY